jgi:hypothetical protein
MNKTATIGWTATLVAVVTLLATNGKALVEAFHAAWLFMLTLAEGAPLGLSSFVLAVALSVAVQIVVRRHWPAEHLARRALAVDAIGIGVAFLAVWLQMRTNFGMLLALLAGFMAPTVSRGVAALWCLRRKS